jgi:hypothetical protein
MVSADAVNDDGSGNHEHWHVLMHEYAHLVQDRNTVSGIFEFLAFIMRIEAAAKALSKSPNGAVTLPLEPVARSALPVYSLIRILQLPGQAEQPTFRNPSANWQFKAYAAKKTPVEIEGARLYRIDTMVIFENETTRRESEYMLGSREIREAYSVAVQELHGGPTPDSEEQFEYCAVPKILAALLGHVDAWKTVAICHWALQSPTPAMRLFEICEMLNANTSALHGVSAIDIYDMLRRDAMVSGLPEAMAKIRLVFAQLIRDYQELNGPLFEAVRRHNDHVERAFARMLDASRRFPLDTALCRDRQYSYADSFRRLTKEEPIPQVESLDGYDYAFGDDSDDDADQDLSKFLRSMRGLIDFLLTADERFRPCPIFAPCSLPQADGDCRTAPWEKSRIAPRCPYGAAAHALGVPQLYTIVL